MLKRFDNPLAQHPVGTPAPGRWPVLLAGIHAVGAVTGGTATGHPHGSLITASGSGLEIRLTAR